MPKGKYFNANEEDGCSLLAMAPFSSILPLRINKSFKHKLDVVVEIRRSHFRWCPQNTEYKLMGREVLQNIISKPSYIPYLKRNVLRVSDELMSFAGELQARPSRLCSDLELAQLIERHYELVLDLLEFGFPTSMMELSNDLLSNHLREIISKKIRRYGRKRSAADYFQYLTEERGRTPASAEKEKRLLLSLKIEKNRRSLSEKLKTLIAKHARKFFWIDFGYQGPTRTLPYFRKEILALARHGVARQELSSLRKRILEVGPNRRTAERELHLIPAEKRLFADARDCVHMKTYRKEALIFSLAVLEPYIREIGRRAKVSTQHVRCCLPTEIMALLKGKLSYRQLEERDSLVFYYCQKGKIIVTTGKQAHKLLHKYIIDERASENPLIHGTTGCPGHAKGIVKIVNVAADMKKMNQGDILVSIATIPELVPAMKKAAAIVTDIGGITSHAAIVSRELRKPCVIGTRVATKTYKDGDMVEVDANHGWVKKITT